MKLTPQDIDAVVARARTGESQKSIAIDYGVSQCTVSYAITGKRRPGYRCSLCGSQGHSRRTCGREVKS